MEMKWHPIDDGNMKGVPRDEELIFTVLNEDTGEVRTASGQVDEYFLKKYGYVFVGTPKYPVENTTLKAWMKLPPAFKLIDCDRCVHWKEWIDEFGDDCAQCELIVDPPFLFSTEQDFKCPLNG